MTDITLAELAKHNQDGDLWISVEGKVLDVSDFVTRHPGGSAILRKVAGTEATKHFLKFHPTSVLNLLKPHEIVGTLADYEPPAVEELSEEDQQLALNRENMPALSEVLNLFDFEKIARHTVNRTAWYYYSSGADDEITMRENHRAFQRIWFRPKVLVDVAQVDTSTTLLGQKTAAPFYVTATALAKLGHPEGETVLTQAAGRQGAIQMVSTLSSRSIDDVMATARPQQPVWMQVYVNQDREVTYAFMRHCEKLGVKGFFVTVDIPQLGRREKDMRVKYDAELADVQNQNASVERNEGAARAISGFIDPGLQWSDIPKLRKITKLPVVIKGVQRWEDAVKAAEYGLDGVVLSNHGGRQLEFSRSGIEVLAETMRELRKRKLHNKIEVYIDGGVRRGTDVLKAVALGAKGVGIGRPFLYAMSTYGVDGVARAMQLLQDEIEMGMRLLGVTKIADLSPKLLDIGHIGAHDAVPADHSQDDVYEHLLQPQFRQKM